MASVTTPYYTARALLLGAGLDLDTDEIKIALVSSTYTPDAAHTIWADVSANEITGTGYTAGGQSLANKSISPGSNGAAKFDADDPSWPGATITVRYAVIYKLGTVGALVNPLICWVLLNDTPADIVIAATTFTLIFHADGVVEL